MTADCRSQRPPPFSEPQRFRRSSRSPAVEKIRDPQEMALDRRRNPNRGPGDKPKDSDSRGNHLHTPPHGTEIPSPDEVAPSDEAISESRERLYKQHLFAADY